MNICTVSADCLLLIVSFAIINLSHYFHHLILFFNIISISSTSSLSHLYIIYLHILYLYYYILIISMSSALYPYIHHYILTSAITFFILISWSLQSCHILIFNIIFLCPSPWPYLLHDILNIAPISLSSLLSPDLLHYIIIFSIISLSSPLYHYLLHYILIFFIISLSSPQSLNIPLPSTGDPASCPRVCQRGLLLRDPGRQVPRHTAHGLSVRPPPTAHAPRPACQHRCRLCAPRERFYPWD